MRIEGLNVSHPWFRISDYGGGAPPFTLGTGEVRTITVEYAPQDSAYAACFIELTGNACDGNRFYADGGSSTALPPNINLRVVNPNGGEHLLAGDTVVITWEGVLPEEKIKLEYSTDAGSTWMFLTQATGLRYTWRIGKQPGGQCLLRATARSQPTFIEGMALIPPGSFLMGNTTGNAEGLSDEEPVHQVTLTRPFLMSRTEVTQAQYETVMGNNPSSFIGDDLPVEGTTWYDAVAFCNRLSKLESRDTCYTGSGESIVCDFTAKGYRLPTEAEWEYACRGGEETDFYTGNMTQPEYSPLDPALDRAGWYGGNSNGQYQPVGLKESNSFGLYDMHGNVMEWCWDRYAGYASGPSTDPRGPDVGGSRVHRGSGWWTGASPCRSARRGSGAPDWISVYKLSGFRIVRTY
jgi:formylglycine-generating enzyme required for sulfatase activity